MDFIFRILIIFVLMLDFISHIVFWLYSLKPVKKIPKINNKVLLLSATKLARMIRKREISSEYVVQTYINRIKEVNPIINAVVEDRFALALKEAIYVDYYINLNILSDEQLERFKPFFGVPITIKESIGLQGLSQAVGHKKNEDRKAPEDSDSVKKLKLAGCIPILVSATPELCIGLETNNLVTGITRNPYNTNLISGGSSGGEGALLGSGSSVIGIGSDFAGSIRIPAMFNGIFGHKASPKIITRRGHYPETGDSIADEYFSIGPMARYAIDLKPLLAIMAGENGILLNLNEKVNIKDINVFYTKDTIFGVPVQREIKDGIQNAANYLSCSYGIKTDIVSFSELVDAVEMGASIFLNIKDVPNFLENPKNPKKNLSLFWEIIKCIIGQSNMSFLLLIFIFVHKYNGFVPKSRFPFHFQNMQTLKSKFVNTLGTNGVFLYPTFPTSAFEHYHILTKPFGISYSMIFNLLGCPSTQVPIGFDSNRMPIGIQIVAAPNQDRLCLAVAEELEKCFGGWIPPN